MVSRGARERLAPALVLALGLVVAEPAARACSEDPPRPDLVVFRPDGRGVTALLAPAGRVVGLGFDGGGWAAWTLGGRFRDLSAALSGDGSTVVTIHPEHDPESTFCALTRMTVRATDLRTGRTTEVGEVGTSPTYLDITPALSHSGRRVAVRAASMATGGIHQEIFDVDSRTRERVVLADEVVWIDDDLFVAAGPEGSLEVMRASDGAALGEVLGAPASGPVGQLRAHADRSAVTLIEAPDTLVTATLGPASLSVERRPLPRPLSAGRDGSSLVAWSDEYARLVWQRCDEGRLPQLEIVDATTGELLWRVSGQAAYTAVHLSSDGGALALVSHEPILFDGLGDTDSDSAPTLELVDLSTGRVVSWGARQRSVARRP